MSTSTDRVGALHSDPPSAAVLSFSSLDRDARVQRQIRALMSIFKVTAMGFSDPCIKGVNFVDLSRRVVSIPRKSLMALRLKTRRFETVYHSQESVRKAADALGDHDFDLLVANDINTLPITLAFRDHARVLFDAHEYSPKEYSDRFVWRFFVRDYIEYLCRTRIPQVDAMTTVSPTIAKEYEHEFGVRASVVLNAPRYHKNVYLPHDGTTIRMVHHGGTMQSRRPEIMIEAMAHLDERFRLDFMLIPNDAAYLSRLKKRAISDPRIRFVPPVAPDEIVETISSYDVGLYALPPASFNSRYALPNKFFDFVQARLCVAIGPSPEMKGFVERYKFGVISADFTPKALATALRTLDRQRVEAFRRAANIAAAKMCYERSEDVLLTTVRRLLGT